MTLRSRDGYAFSVFRSVLHFVHVHARHASLRPPPPVHPSPPAQSPHIITRRKLRHYCVLSYARIATESTGERACSCFCSIYRSLSFSVKQISQRQQKQNKVRSRNTVESYTRQNKVSYLKSGSGKGGGAHFDALAVRKLITPTLLYSERSD